MPNKSFSDLADSVTSRGLCRLCGACALICPVDVIRVSQARAELVGECISCGLCSAVCPVINEPPVFKPRKIVLARPKESPPKFKTCGATTTILSQLLSQGMVDAVLVSRMESEASPRSYLARTTGDVRAAGGANYFSFGHIHALKQPIKEGRRIATVGVGCCIEGLRHVMSKSKVYSKSAGCSIGVFCSAQLDRERTLSLLEDRGVSANQVASINIRGGRAHIAKEGGGELAVSLSELDQAKRRCCAFCLDVDNVSADVSIGEMGAPDGFVILLARTEIGEEILNLSKDVLQMREATDEVLLKARAAIARKSNSLAKIKRTEPI
jgi:coenzyme F420-reducing hydrogenase beta subunit